ncbi:MAG: N-acetylmuramoyl-L-alanine amidase [Hespellia sp.]|nr:N-acetylmuramoyl-L-alanine amidase [Hespellia sp.]
MPYSIMLDAGHGGRDPGAVYHGRQEKDDTLNLVLAIGQILQESGIDVQYTRTTDIYETPFQKATEANEAGVDYFVSIHRNSFPTENTASGVESLVYDNSGIKVVMAKNINAQLAEIGFRNLGVQVRPNLIVLKRTKMPAVLVEVGFINNDADNALFDSRFEDIAQAIANGILETLNLNSMNSSDMDDIFDPENHFPQEEGSDMPDNPQTEIYHVQTGAFRNETYAKRLLNELLSQDYPAFIDDRSRYYRVRVGTFNDLNDAAAMERRLKRAGYATTIVSHAN